MLPLTVFAALAFAPHGSAYRAASAARPRGVALSRRAVQHVPARLPAAIHAEAATVSAPVPYSQLSVGVVKETFPLERRVVQSPDSVKLLTKAGITVKVEAGAGVDSLFDDAAYVAAGAQIVSTAEAWQQDVVLKLRPPTPEQAELLGSRTLISLINPSKNEALLRQFEAQKATVFALDMIPRLLSRGQTYDVLSSQTNIAGYRAVIEASNAFSRFFAGQMTAAGKVPPAKVLVLGAGVAGLAAIQTAKNMGAIVRAYDVRPVVKEQVESLGGQFLKVDYQEDGSGTGGYAKEMSDGYKQAEAKLMREQAEDVDIIITTALIPNRPAPKLVSQAMIDGMKRGSVIVDLAAENGGNTVLTKKDEVYVTPSGVSILGYTDLVSRLPTTASNLFGNNVAKFLLSIGPTTQPAKDAYAIDYADDAVRGMLVVHEGDPTYPAPPYSPPEPPKKAAVEKAPPKPVLQWRKFAGDAAKLTALAALLTALGRAATPELSVLLTTFALSCLAGYQAVLGVPPALHSPLMSVTNAVSGLTAVGAMLLLPARSFALTGTAQILGAAALVASAINSEPPRRAARPARLQLRHAPLRPATLTTARSGCVSAPLLPRLQSRAASS